MAVTSWSGALTLAQFVRDLSLVLGAHADLPLISQKGLLDRVKHQRVEEAVLENRQTDTHTHVNAFSSE